MERPFIIAVTGGAGAGKSAAVHHFAERGAAVIDSDDVAHRVLEDPVVRDELVDAFGPEILDEMGDIDREALAQTAFHGTQSVARLNAITHPRISDEIVIRVEDLAQTPSVEVIVLEIPLLDGAPEVGGRCEVVVAIEAPLGVRIARLVARGMSEADARRRIGLQPSDAERRRSASAVVVNDADESTYEERLDRVWEYFVGPFGAEARDTSAGPEPKR